MSWSLKPAWLAADARIGARVGGRIAAPLRFKLEEVGIGKRELRAAFADTFARLPWDLYDLKRAQVDFLRSYHPDARRRLDRFLKDYYTDTAGLRDVRDLQARLSRTARREFKRLQPFRRRAVANFTLGLEGDDSWRVIREPASIYTQPVGRRDSRSLGRRFSEMPGEVTRHRAFEKLLVAMGRLVRLHRPKTEGLRVTAHQIRTVARPDQPGYAAPEGIHRDGADFILSALVLGREGVTGGTSVVYGPHTAMEFLRHTLRTGEGLFHDDRAFSHDVTPIEFDPASALEEGVRDVIGFDISLA